MTQQRPDRKRLYGIAIGVGLAGAIFAGCFVAMKSVGHASAEHFDKVAAEVRCLKPIGAPASEAPQCQ